MWLTSTVKIRITTHKFIVHCSSCGRNEAGNQTSHCDSHFMRSHNLRNKTRFLQVLAAFSRCLRIHSLVPTGFATCCRLSPLDTLFFDFSIISSVNTTFHSVFPLHFPIPLSCIVAQACGL